MTTSKCHSTTSNLSNAVRRVTIKNLLWKVKNPMSFMDLVVDSLAEIIDPTIMKPMDDYEAIKFDWEQIGNDLKKVIGK